MPQVIVVEHPRYASVYRNRTTQDRPTLDDGEAWAMWVDEHADSVATPQYLAEHSTDPRRPNRHLGNQVTYCVIPLVASWGGQVPNYYQPGPPQSPVTPTVLRQAVADRLLRIKAEIVDASVATYQRAARWSRPRGVISVLVGHGLSLAGLYGHPGSARVDLAPGSAATAETTFLRQLESIVRARRGQGESFEHIAQDSWDPDSTAILRMGAAFRGAHVRRVDLLVCQSGIGIQGRTFLNLLARFWGCQVRGMRGSAGYRGGGVWDVVRPHRPPPTFSMRVRPPEQQEHRDGAVMATNDPASRGSSSFMEGPIPGYPPNSVFTSSRSNGSPL